MSTSFEPQAFGRYFLVDKIAVGGMAEVFKAKSYAEGGFEKLLVIKRILGHLSENEEFVEMFIDEAKISVELQHPNVVQIFDFGKSGDNWYIAMELVEGKDAKGILRRLARRRKLMPTEFAVLIAHEVCKGLDYAHKKTDLRGTPLNIIHRDMSPSNIIVGYRGDVKVADFGIAKARKSSYTTKDGVLKGKFEYMSPEQARGAEISARSDVFSLGIVLHEMLTGRRLFKTDSDLKTLERIKAGGYPKPSEANPRIPPSLDAVVMKALAVDPNERYADARSMQAALLEYLYPQTPDVVQERLRRFMEELFAEDIDEERTRLEEGSARAEVLRQEAEDAEASWTPPVNTVTTVQPPPSRVPLLLAGAAVVLLAALVLFLVMREPETRIVDRIVEVQAPAPDKGTLQLVITPDTASPVVYVGEDEVARGTTRVTVEGLVADQDLVLKVVADGFETYTETFRAGAGERIRLPVALKAVAAPPPERVEVVERTVETPPADTPPPAAKPASIVFTTTPSGAEVLVDGRSIGRTPLTWPSAVAGKTHKVEYRLSGYQASSAKVRVPDQGGEVSGSANLKPESLDPGELFVNVKGGWGEVWVDGSRIDTTPLKHQLPPGTYRVKVVNAEAGLDETRSVTIVSGKTQKLTFEL